MRLLTKVGLVHGIGARPLTAALSFFSSLRIAIIIWVLSASGTCLASGDSYAPIPRRPTAPLLWDQGGAIADLDGDGRPDLATVIAQGWGPNGFQYRIELELTSGIGSSFLTVSAEKDGLRIVPRDVDGDRDLDLVITSDWSLAPVGVWINDGHGRFTQGDLTAYPRSIWTEDSGVLSDAPQEALQATVTQSYRSLIDFSSGSYFWNELVFERPLLLAAATSLKEVVRQPQTRAPPRPSPQQPN